MTSLATSSDWELATLDGAAASASVCSWLRSGLDATEGSSLFVVSFVHIS